MHENSSRTDQNSSLTEEFAQLQADWKPLAWADAAFGAPPVATNLWMGEAACQKPGLYAGARAPCCRASGWGFGARRRG